MDIIIKYTELEKGAQNEMVHIKGGKKKKVPQSSPRVNSSKTIKDWYHKISPKFALFFPEDPLIFFLLLTSSDSKIHVKTYQVKLKLVALVRYYFFKQKL